MTRADIRTRVRDAVYEDSADLLSDAKLNRMFEDELRFLPTERVFKQEIWERTTEQNIKEYTLPSGSVQVEKVFITHGTTAPISWSEVNGFKEYAGAVILPFYPSGTETLRIEVLKKFTIVSNVNDTLDIDDEKTDVLVKGITIRAYNSIIGYYAHSKNHNAVTSPNGVSMRTIEEHVSQLRTEYRGLLDKYAVPVQAQDINLVG